MSENRVQFNTIVSSQLPQYVQEDFPLISDFLKQYYLGQEYQGGPIDLIQNIDKYIKLDETTGLVESVVLNEDTNFYATTINVDPTESPTGTKGFPDTYGLLKIDNEIITYTGKTDFSFTGCRRGFVGITSYRSELNKEELIFESTEADDHNEGSTIENLSNLFLREFLLKTKHQLLPGLENRSLTSELNQNLFIKQSKDFYLSKGTDRSFEILFKALYNKDVSVIRPSDYLFTPSNANYEVVNQMIVEPIEGDPENLDTATLYQDSYGFGVNLQRSYAPITSVEKIEVGFAKTFYKLNFDGGYNRDIGVDGVEYGQFKVEPSTKVISQVSSGSSVIDVDSTVGFGTTGELYVTYSDTTTGVVSYTSKSLTQFFGVTNLTGTINDATKVGVNTFSYGRSILDQDEIIKIRINSVFDSPIIPDNTTNFKRQTTANVTTLGVSEDNLKYKNWLYNVSPIYKVSKVVLTDASDNTYNVTLDKKHYFKIGNTAELILNDGSKKSTTIINIQDEKSFSIRGQGALSPTNVNKIQRKIQKGSSNTFPEISTFSTDIDNVYKSDSNDCVIASPSIPKYNSQPIEVTPRELKFSGTFNGDTFEISPGVEHGYYTGDSIYYSARLVDQQFINAAGSLSTRRVRDTALFDDGLYFIQRVNGFTVKFAKSRKDIYKSNFIELKESTTITDSIIRPSQFNGKSLKPQKILRKISSPQVDGSINETKPGFTGILVNGVEVLNYKSKDLIRYGKIESIDILSPTQNIDVVRPPELLIQDTVGTGATAHVAVSGSLREVRVVDPGFDYLSVPTLKVEGGNGQGADGQVIMKSIRHAPEFFADEVSAKVTIGTTSTESRIGFATYHKFRNVEEVIYRTKDQKAITGLNTDSQYYISTIDNVTVRLHPTKADALAGINTVFLTGFGEGKHSLESVNLKRIVSAVNIVSSGSGYENKKRTAPAATGISTSTNAVNISNHDYKTGERIKYTCIGTPVSGLTTNTEYYVTTVDKNSFKLSSVGISSDKEFYYRTKQYVDFTSVGVGTHVFNYPDITATLVGDVGISSVGTETFKAQIEPIVRGTPTSIHVQNGGVGYGSSEIIGLDHQPTISLKSGTNAQLSPVVSNGKIEQVIILNGGSGYVSTPDIEIDGDGFGAVLVPVLTNGVITEVKVRESGAGFDQGSTTITVIGSGQDQISPVFYAKIKSWRVNLFEKNYPYFKSDDGVLVEGNNELQYSHLYAPRVLRQSVYSIDVEGNILYGESDLRRVNSIEESTSKHSPILGFAYDGNPIYGPYGYSRKNGGVVTQMKSGYSLDLKPGRPSTSIFPEGFFVEDYTHKQTTDESVLDENNGRFCITPDYPQGTYAYFMTVNNQFADSSGVFQKYRRPVFPYIIGQNYHAIPNEFNFLNSSNQDSYEFNDLRRNTEPLNLIEGDSEYPYINIPNKLNQTLNITATSPGTVKSIGIVTSGTNYRVGEDLVFDNDGTGGDGVSARVSRVKGRSITNISVASSTIENVEIYPANEKGFYRLYSENPHKFIHTELVTVSGLSTTATGIEGTYNAGVSTNRLAIIGVGTTAVAIGTDGVTGLVTYFNVGGNLFSPSIKENDILSVGTERVKVLNVDLESSRIRVLRAVDGTVSTAHTIGKYLLEDPRKLLVNVGYSTTYNYRENEQIYFDPAEAVGLGTTAGVGIGTTISFSNPGAGITQKFIPTKSIYIRNHNLQTGDQLTYSPGTGGTGLYVEDETNAGIGTTLTNGQKVFVAKLDDDLIGIATVRVGLGTTGTFVGIASTHRSSSTLFFKAVGVGDTHSFKTNHSVITGNISKNTVTVSTASTHGLSPDHKINISVNPRSSKTVVVKYDDYNRRILINPLGFTSTGINTSTGAITISDHGLRNGQKVIYTATDVADGLTNENVYYVSRVDQNRFKLSDTFFDATKDVPVSVGIASTGTNGGTISPVNPPITLYKDSTVTFDLSDSSLGYTILGSDYPAFDFNLYNDVNFTKIWNKSDDSKTFELTKSGQVGSAGAKAVLSVNNNIPETLYYNLDLVYNADIPKVKTQVSADNEVAAANEIKSRNSLYNGSYPVTVGTTTTFTYTLKDVPESVSYASTTSTLLYDTDCTHTYGPIHEVRLLSPGKNYYSLPSVSSVDSLAGTGAILEASGSNVGELKSFKLNNIGFDLPSDQTLKPNILLPQTIKVETLAIFDSVGITSFGRGYSIEPKLVVIDGKTNKIVDDVDLKMTLGSPNVEIFRNTNGISNVTPTIIPTLSDSGVGIGTIEYFESTKEALVKLTTASSNYFDVVDNPFPFAVGDKILIEGVSVGVGSTGKGYNSSGYNYKLFDVTEVTPNYGGIGSVRFSMSGYFEEDEFPGKIDLNNSAGRMTPQKHFPIFLPILDLNNYLIGETVTSDTTTGKVDDWNPRLGILRVSSEETFIVGEKITGNSSKVESIPSSVESFASFINFGPYSKVIRGWQNDSGELNFVQQKIQDSDYYQKFSYSLKSEIEYDTWNDPVASLNHTLGYKKFSDYQLESTSDNNMSVQLSSGELEVISDVDSFASLHCVHDFDIATENNFSSGTISDEIVFSNRILTDYFESVGNRVLSIDDISGIFNSEPRSTPFSVVSTFDLSEIKAQKYITYVRDKRYTAQRQILIVDLVHNGTNAFMNQYGRVETTYDQGSFDFSISGTDGQLLFYPTKSAVNDYELTTLSYNLSGDALGVGSTNIGGVASIETKSTSVTTGVTTTIVSIASTYNSAKVLVNITPDTNDTNEYELVELNIINYGSHLELLEFGRLTTHGFDGLASSGFGTYRPYIEDSQLKVDFAPAVGIATTGVINTMTVGLATHSSTGIGTVSLQRSTIEARTTSITASGSPGFTTISEFSGEADGAYFIIQVTDTTNDRIQLSEAIVVDSFVDASNPYDSFFVEYANLESSVGLGTIGSIVDSNGKTSLVFTPIPSINAEVNVFKNSLCLVVEDPSSGVAIPFGNGSVRTQFGSYTGTESDIMRTFGLTHENNEIFERYVVGNDSNVINLTDNTITIPNHFFVSGEKIEYAHVGDVTSAIGIATTSFSGVGNTTFLPGEEIFAIKVDDNTIRVAASATNALKSVPIAVELESVGIGTSHRFVATNQNAKVLVAIDNVIQSPVVSTAVTTGLSTNMTVFDTTIKVSGITSFFGADLIKINNEIVKIEGVGVGSTNSFRIRRGWLGTNPGAASTGALVTKVSGNYNIVGNALNFAEAPFGGTPIGSTTNPPDERDYEGITTSSSFQGRSFMRSGTQNGSTQSYAKNYIFDNVSNKFDATENEFTLVQNGSNVTGITNENAIVLINDVFQVPASDQDYTLNETAGITSITFNGSTPQSPLGADVGISSFPKGGIIVSVGSTEGFGYQPLVSAGGSAIVSSAGTITSVSIGNSGSGYRSGIQTNLSVGVQLPDTSGTTIIPIGIASISGGHVTSVAITTDRVFYAPRDISNVLYDHTTGLTTVTTSTAHGLSGNEEIIVSGIAFTCDYSGSGPVNVSNAVYDNISGIMTVTTSSPHNLSTTGQKSDVLLTGLGFTCGIDGGSSTHTYPRTTDPIYCGAKVTAVTSSTVFVINAGVSTVPTFFQSGGTAQPSIIAPRVNNNSASGFDPASQGSSVLRIINTTSFEINSGISTRAHFYARCGTVKKPLDVIFDEPASYSNMRLFYSSSSAAGVGTEATADIVVGQGSSVIDFELNNTGYGYGNGQILTVAIGGTTGIPTTTSFSGNEFQLTIDEVFTDKFSGWSVGTLQVLDSIEGFIDGVRKDFQLKENGAITSIVSSPGSKINVQDVLLVFVNTILQVPGEGYTFEGGSTITFTEALKIGDKVTILFYKGNGDSDVIFRDVIETVKKGDTLQLKHNAGDQPASLEEDVRSVFTVLSTGNVETNPYYGPGNTNDVTLERPVTWCRQTEDKIIDEVPTGKDRELYEPVINPSAYIIKSVGVGSTAIYVDSLRPLFDTQNESSDLAFQKKIKFVKQEPKSGAAATAVVSGLGTISSVVISDGGVGYTTATVSFGYTSSSRAFGSVTISAGGTVTGVAITSPGVGYTFTNPPTVLISPPGYSEEEVSVNNYFGDNGIIVGFGSTSVGVGTTQLIFDIHIPFDSVLRNSTIAGTAVTISSIQENDYFIVRNSTVGIASTTVTSLDSSGNTVGVGTSFADNVYEVASVETLSTSVLGISTQVKRLFVNVAGFATGFSGITTSDYGFGIFNWGRIDTQERSVAASYTAYTQSGIGITAGSGISTSPMIVRSNFLKSKNYI